MSCFTYCYAECQCAKYSYAKCHYAVCLMPSVIMLSVVLPSVTAPKKKPLDKMIICLLFLGLFFLSKKERERKKKFFDEKSQLLLIETFFDVIAFTPGANAIKLFTAVITPLVAYFSMILTELRR